MRHRQLLGDNLVRLDVDDDAAVGAAVAPAVDHVRPAYRGRELRQSIDHRQAVHVAAILARQLRDEIRFPNGLEAVGDTRFAYAAVGGVDENHLAVVADAQFVDVDVACRLHVARHVKLVVLIVGDLARRQRVLEPDDLRERAEVDAVFVTDDAHRLGIMRHVQRQAAVWRRPDQIQSPGLVRGEGNRAVVVAEELREPGREIEIGRAGCHGRLLVCRPWCRCSLIRHYRLGRIRLIVHLHPPPRSKYPVPCPPVLRPCHAARKNQHGLLTIESTAGRSA